MHAVLTVGHSNRELAEFLQLLGVHEVERIVDVRRFPGSYRLPHFGGAVLPGALAGAGIDYVHVEGLGGRRRVDPDAPAEVGDAWRHTSFRAYAQHTRSEEFAAAFADLVTLAAECTTAIMCAEAVPWRCHRWLVSDVLVGGARVPVRHILDEGAPREHLLSPFAAVEGGVVSWPGPESAAKLRLGERWHDAAQLAAE
jgi:uncharacterized protein (DUF488 family)